MKLASVIRSGLLGSLSFVTAYAADDLSLQNLSVSTGQIVTHEANATIQTSANVTIQSGGELNLTAGNRITLGPGFHAQSSSKVTLRAGMQYIDADGDLMRDSWEIANGLSPSDAADASGDPDSDGLTNLQEYRLGTNPRLSQGGSSNAAELKILKP